MKGVATAHTYGHRATHTEHWCGVVAASAAALQTTCGSSHAGAWWDCRETLEKLDVSQNELSALPELASLPELRELLLSHNQLQLLPSLAVRESTRTRPQDAHCTKIRAHITCTRDARSSAASARRRCASATHIQALVELKLLEASHNRLTALPEDLGAALTLALTLTLTLNLNLTLTLTPTPTLSLTLTLALTRSALLGPRLAQPRAADEAHRHRRAGRRA